MRIILDTNILVSATLYPKSVPGSVLGLAAEGKIELFVSPFILSELEIVLASHKIGLGTGEVRKVVQALKEIVRVVEPKVQVQAIPKNDADNRILACAVEAKANVLVTGNMKHIRPLGKFQSIEILTPREFLERYFPGR